MTSSTVDVAVQLEEAAVAVDRAGARDDAEAIVREPRHGHVADDAAALVEQLRVDDRADRLVDPVVADALEQRRAHPAPETSSLPNDVMSMIPTPLAHRRVLDRDAVVVRRPSPSRTRAGPRPRAATARPGRK